MWDYFPQILESNQAIMYLKLFMMLISVLSSLEIVYCNIIKKLQIET